MLPAGTYRTALPEFPRFPPFLLPQAGHKFHGRHAADIFYPGTRRTSDCFHNQACRRFPQFSPESASCASDTYFANRRADRSPDLLTLPDPDTGFQAESYHEENFSAAQSHIVHGRSTIFFERASDISFPAVLSIKVFRRTFSGSALSSDNTAGRPINSVVFSSSFRKIRFMVIGFSPSFRLCFIPS